MLCGHPGLCPHDLLYLAASVPVVGCAVRWVAGCCSRCCRLLHRHRGAGIHDAALHHGEERPSAAA